MKFRMSRRDARKSYAVDEQMSNEWLERWSGFTSVRAAETFARKMDRFARKMDGQCYGALRVTRVTREPVKVIT